MARAPAAATESGRTRRSVCHSRRNASDGLRHAVQIVHRVCCIAGSAALLDDIRTEGVLRKAIRKHDTAAVFDWLITTLSYQGISDQVARGYMQRHGQATWRDIELGIDNSPSCLKLRSYWHFHGCR